MLAENSSGGLRVGMPIPDLLVDYYSWMPEGVVAQFVLVLNARRPMGARPRSRSAACRIVHTSLPCCTPRTARVLSASASSHMS